MAHYDLHMPIDDAQIRALRAGDTVTINGTLFGIRERERAFASSSLSASTGWDSFTATYTSVPEPASLGLIGLVGLLAMRRRRTLC